MKEDLKFSILQLDLIWENASSNLQKIESLVAGKLDNTDVLILPEMFSTGFTMNPSAVAESMSGKSVEWMKMKASKWNIVLAGSLVIKEKNQNFNRFLWVTPNGDIQYYDKKHLFRMGEENEHYRAGKQKLITSLKTWRIRPLICYDLRFPVWSRNISDYDVLLYVANWPASRRHVWKSLLLARALENQSYVVGVNRIGEDGNGISYSGDSMIIDPRGNILSNTQPNTESFETVSLSLKELIDFREKFPVSMDADEFMLTDS
ncbi:MAG: amidohydrolase [Bacteroidota bacterium]|nr:amidohydrolase [Bacteroidota bacterium]